MPDQVPADVVKERYQRLVDRVDEIAWEEAKRQIGRTVEVLIAQGEGRKDEATGRLSGRAPDNRLVHFVPPMFEGSGRDVESAAPRPGDVATVTVTYAAPHHLVADGPALAVRRTPAGDAWERREAADACGVPGSTPAVVGLGVPAVGVPATAPSEDLAAHLVNR
jgi:tRNA-2-methylthio-N6-dimethylallyladenosine synthase